jgi:hypothetical protein
VAGKADFDIWAADGKFTYGHCTATFVRCAVAGKHTWPGLTARYDNTGHTQRPHDTERRWQEARRLPHDETLPLPDRIAGLLVLLYAQNPADIEGLPTTAANDDWTIITLALASVPIVLPDPWPGSCANTSPPAAVTPPSGSPAQCPGCSPAAGVAIPSTPGTSANGSKPSACTPAPTAPPRCSPWLPNCPPRSSPGCSGSASAPRLAGRRRPPATGWPTPLPSAARQRNSGLFWS